MLLCRVLPRDAVRPCDHDIEVAGATPGSAHRLVRLGAARSLSRRGLPYPDRRSDTSAGAAGLSTFAAAAADAPRGSCYLDNEAEVGLPVACAVLRRRDLRQVYATTSLMNPPFRAHYRRVLFIVERLSFLWKPAPNRGQDRGYGRMSSRAYSFSSLSV